MRRDSRETAFKIIFESLFNENPFNDEILAQLKEKDKSFCEEIIKEYLINKEKIEKGVNSCLKGYNLDRVYKIDLALIYEAITEIEFLKTPPAVAINEILDIAKKYSTENSPKFINGVLSAYVKGEINNNAGSN